MTLPTLKLELDRLAPLQQTLFIPLVGRARAAASFPALGFSDPVAEGIVERLGYSGLGVLERDRKIVWGTVIRTLAFDDVTREFAAEQPDGVALSLGVGLCTRACRFPGLRWTELDVPEVIAARDAMMDRGPTTTRRAVDLRRPDELRGLLEGLDDRRPALVSAEGLLMFLAPREQRAVLRLLDAHLPDGSLVVFDYVHPWIPRLRPFHGSIRVTGARYRSGFIPHRDLAGLRRLVPNGLHRFRDRLMGPLRWLQTGLGWLAGSPLYDIACLRVSGGQ